MPCSGAVSSSDTSQVPPGHVAPESHTGPVT